MSKEKRKFSQSFKNKNIELPYLEIELIKGEDIPSKNKLIKKSNGYWRSLRSLYSFHLWKRVFKIINYYTKSE
jgi:hypothetical protein